MNTPFMVLVTSPLSVTQDMSFFHIIGHSSMDYFVFIRILLLFLVHFQLEQRLFNITFEFIKFEN